RVGATAVIQLFGTSEPFAVSGVRGAITVARCWQGLTPLRRVRAGPTLGCGEDAPRAGLLAELERLGRGRLLPLQLRDDLRVALPRGQVAGLMCQRGMRRSDVLGGLHEPLMGAARVLAGATCSKRQW